MMWCPCCRAILQVPMTWDLVVTQEDLTITDPAVRERLNGQRDHVRLYGRDYVDRLTRAGFVVHVDHLAEELGADQRARMGLQNEVIITGTTDQAAAAPRHPGRPNR